MKRLLLCAAFAAALTAACVSSTSPPGPLIGNFSFETQLPYDSDGGLSPEAEAAFSDCTSVLSAEVRSDAGNFTFDGVLYVDAGVAWLASGGQLRSGTIEWPLFVSSVSAERRFSECTCQGDSKVFVDETLSLVLLSSSQAAALDSQGVRCPPNPFDGGVPLDPAAGIVGPSESSSGVFDVVRACGGLEDIVRPTLPSAPGVKDGCSCVKDNQGLPNGDTCFIRYPLLGTRRGGQP